MIGCGLSAAADFLCLISSKEEKMAFFKKKEAPEMQEPMDVEAVMKKYDRESNTRVWEGVPKIIVTCILAAFSILFFVAIFS